MQVSSQAGKPGSDFPQPNRLTRRTRASRLAPLPVNSAAHIAQAACANLPPTDPSDVLSRQSNDAAGQSQACSDHANRSAISASAEANLDTRDAEGNADAELHDQAPREGTPVSSNRRPYRVSLITNTLVSEVCQPHANCKLFHVLTVPAIMLMLSHLKLFMTVSAMVQNIHCWHRHIAKACQL